MNEEGALSGRSRDTRFVTREELRDFAILILSVDSADPEAIERFHELRRKRFGYIDDQIAKCVATKERRRAYLGAIVQWLGTGIGAIVLSWVTGALPWLLNSLGWKG